MRVQSFVQQEQACGATALGLIRDSPDKRNQEFVGQDPSSAFGHEQESVNTCRSLAEIDPAVKQFLKID